MISDELRDHRTSARRSVSFEMSALDSVISVHRLPFPQESCRERCVDLEEDWPHSSWPAIGACWWILLLLELASDGLACNERQTQF